jgi:hypothetical protein
MGVMTLQRAYCAELALAEGATLPGTADVVDAWIMLEYLPAWTAKATSDNSLAAATRAWLDRLRLDAVARGLKPRQQFIRRPELDRTRVTLMIAVDGALHRVEANDYDALCELSLNDVLARTPIQSRQYFVCTNGQRDLCCARFGLPTYAALRERVGERVWQTTHVGGHRFAPNVLTLPQAALYGRVGTTDVEAFLAAIENDRLAAPWLRGRTRYSPEVQAAEAALLALGLDTTGAVSTQALGDGGMRVAFGSNAAQVRHGTAVDVQSSCSDAQRKSVTPLIVSVET